MSHFFPPLDPDPSASASGTAPPTTVTSRGASPSKPQIGSGPLSSPSAYLALLEQNEAAYKASLASFPPYLQAAFEKWSEEYEADAEARAEAKARAQTATGADQQREREREEEKERESALSDLAAFLDHYFGPRASAREIELVESLLGGKERFKKDQEEVQELYRRAVEQEKERLAMALEGAAGQAGQAGQNGSKGPFTSESRGGEAHWSPARGAPVAPGALGVPSSDPSAPGSRPLSPRLGEIPPPASMPVVPPTQGYQPDLPAATSASASASVPAPRVAEDPSAVAVAPIPQPAQPAQPAQEAVSTTTTADPIAAPDPTADPAAAAAVAVAAVADAPNPTADPAATAAQVMPSTPRRLPNGELYERLAHVGEGTYGKVYKARNSLSGAFVALKRIRMEGEKDGFPVTAMREIKLLQNLRHRNILRLIEMMVSKGESLFIASCVVCWLWAWLRL